MSISVDLDLTKEAFERLEDCVWLSPAAFDVLLRVRQTETTFDSDSDLLFSRLRVPKPNFFRSEEVLDPKEPVLQERFPFNELQADPFVWPCSSEYTNEPK